MFAQQRFGEGNSISIYLLNHFRIVIVQEFATGVETIRLDGGDPGPLSGKGGWGSKCNCEQQRCDQHQTDADAKRRHLRKGDSLFSAEDGERYVEGQSTLKQVQGEKTRSKYIFNPSRRVCGLGKASRGEELELSPEKAVRSC